MATGTGESSGEARDPSAFSDDSADQRAAVALVVLEADVTDALVVAGLREEEAERKEPQLGSLHPEPIHCLLRHRALRPGVLHILV